LLRAIFYLLVLVAVQFESWGQTINLQAQFHGDSIKIGQIMGYSVWVDYPRSAEFIFPDSTYNFAPFEFDRKVFFQTNSDSLRSRDSVVYFLSTFEIDKVQRLALPVFQVDKADSIRYFPAADSVYLIELIEGTPADSLQVRANTSFTEVVLELNYPYILIGAVSFALLALIAFLVFGKSIKRRYRLYRLRKKHQKFILRFDRLISELKISGNHFQVEEALVIWKQYMEKLESIPYTKLTTKEIVMTSQNEHLKKPLKEVDEGIYGHMDLDNIYESFENLEYISVERFQDQVDKVNNG